MYLPMEEYGRLTSSSRAVDGIAGEKQSQLVAHPSFRQRSAIAPHELGLNPASTLVGERRRSTRRDEVRTVPRVIDHELNLSVHEVHVRECRGACLRLVPACCNANVAVTVSVPFS